MQSVLEAHALATREGTHMKKTVTFGLFSLAAGLSWLAFAAVGDIIWVGTRQEGPDLTTPQKTALATLINSDLGAGVAGGLDSEECYQDLKVSPKWTCTVAAERTLTDEQYFTLRKAGKIQPGQATVVVTEKFLATADYTAWVLDVFGLSLNDGVYAFRAERDPDTPTIVHTAYWPIVTGTKTEFRAADSAVPTQVLRIVGEVTE